MAKLFEYDKSNIIKGIFLLIALLAFVTTAMVYNAKEKPQKESKEVYIGVHVKGAVQSSGYYLVPLGTRVIDLEKYTGGYSQNVDLDGVNLAEYVQDGSEVYFPYKGTAETGAVNLNKVTYEELLELDGIGESYARKIISYRSSRGKFEKVIELKDLLGTKVYEAVRGKFYID